MRRGDVGVRGPTAETGPTCEQAFQAFRTLIDFVGRSGATPTSYDQQRLPPGTTRDGYLRRHRRRLREGVSGWTRCGQARVVTREAWTLDVEAETGAARSRASAPTPAPDVNVTDDLDRELGIRARRNG